MDNDRKCDSYDWIGLTVYCLSSFLKIKWRISGGPDRVTRFLGPGQNFQIWMKMDKNLIFHWVFWTQNPVKILSRSATENDQKLTMKRLIFRVCD